MDLAAQPTLWIRFSAAGAHLVWRVKNGAKSMPFTTLRTLSDGSELVLLRESASMLGKRRRDAGDKTLPRLPGTIARLVSFTVTARTAHRVKTTTIKVLTTLLDPGAFPAREIAALYAERWQAEIAYLHLKKTVKGAGRVRRGRSPALARQETWALLLVHNMTATIAARAAASAGIDPDQIPFTAVLSLVRGHVTADTCCPHCGKRPASGNDPIALLIADILAQPPHAAPPRSPRTDLQKDTISATRLAHRRSRVHDHDHPVKPPKGHQLPEVKGSALHPHRQRRRHHHAECPRAAGPHNLLDPIRSRH